MTGDHSHLGYWLDMADKRNDLEGLFVMGQNPAVGAPNARLERRALANLQWLVVRDLVETETATFWHDSPEVQRGELDTAAIATEVFFFPAAAHAEKEGCFTNTQRLLQWRDKAVDPPGDARSESWFVYHLGRRLKSRAAIEDTPANQPLNALTWDYATIGPRRRARHRSGPARDQRVLDARRTAGRGLRRARGGRQHRVRLLDLLRRLPGSRTEPRARQERERSVRTRLGIRVARRSPHPLQPRVRAA